MSGNLSMPKGGSADYVLTEADKQEIADKVGKQTFVLRVDEYEVKTITAYPSNRSFVMTSNNNEVYEFFDYLDEIGIENASFKLVDNSMNSGGFVEASFRICDLTLSDFVPQGDISFFAEIPMSNQNGHYADEFVISVLRYYIYFDNCYLGTHYVNRYSSFVSYSPYEPCIMEGTPINMADGSEKLIEDVRMGDIVLSYDPATETNVPAVVIDCYITGRNRGFDTYHFSDGKWLTLYDLHQIYSKGIGSVKDVRKITRNDQIVNIDGEIVRWTGTSKIYYQGEKKRRYNIITSNNLYYANGILLGHKPFSKLHRVLDSHGKVSASEEIRAVWQKDCDIYNQHNEFLNTKEFNAELAECNRQYASSKHIIEVNKQRLANSDYKVQKRAEGLIDDDEWDESKKKRAGWRNEINEHEVLLKKAEEARRAVIKKYRGDITERSMFEECCVRDNALFDKCKEYFAKGREVK